MFSGGPSRRGAFKPSQDACARHLEGQIRRLVAVCSESDESAELVLERSTAVAGRTEEGHAGNQRVRVDREDLVVAPREVGREVELQAIVPQGLRAAHRPVVALHQAGDGLRIEALCSEVEPMRSAKMIVTTLRASAWWVPGDRLLAVGLLVVRGAEEGVRPRGAPHSPQNLRPSRFSSPHPAQRTRPP